MARLLKILDYQIKKAIFKQNICFIMNLKERGITVGDLLIILIIISLLSISKTDLSLIFIVCIKNYDPSIRILYLIILKISHKISLYILC